MKVTHTDANESFRNYYEGDKSFLRYSMEILDKENVLDPLSMLTLINGENNINERVALVAKLIEGKTVVIYDNDVKVKSFIHNSSGSLPAYFIDEPYLLQVVIDYGYSLILKKLTPPSPVSNEEVSA